MGSGAGKAQTINSMSHIDQYGNRGQCMVLVMHSLSELTGSNTKQEVLRHIRDMVYYNITRHDLPPYPGQNESKYHTLLAWARKDCVERDYVLNNERDAWALSLRGRALISRIHALCVTQEYDVRKCYLWTEKFKKKLDPQYQPSDADAKRPEVVFEELLMALSI
jgi:hypothetical protein